MGDQSPAEQLPAIYRAVLDSVAELERRGERLEASRVRSEAISAYSRSWDRAGRRRLLRILSSAQRVIAETPEPVAELVADVAADAPPPASRTRKRGIATTA